MDRSQNAAAQPGEAPQRPAQTLAVDSRATQNLGTMSVSVPEGPLLNNRGLSDMLNRSNSNAEAAKAELLARALAWTPPPPPDEERDTDEEVEIRLRIERPGYQRYPESRAIKQKAQKAAGNSNTPARGNIGEINRQRLEAAPPKRPSKTKKRKGGPAGGAREMSDWESNTSYRVRVREAQAAGKDLSPYQDRPRSFWQPVFDFVDANEGRRITNAMILSFINANGGSKFMKARQGLKACRAAINQYLSEKGAVPGPHPAPVPPGNIMNQQAIHVNQLLAAPLPTGPNPMNAAVPPYGQPPNHLTQSSHPIISLQLPLIPPLASTAQAAVIMPAEPPFTFGMNPLAAAMFAPAPGLDGGTSMGLPGLMGLQGVMAPVHDLAAQNLVMLNGFPGTVFQLHGDMLVPAAWAGLPAGAGGMPGAMVGVGPGMVGANGGIPVLVGVPPVAAPGPVNLPGPGALQEMILPVVHQGALVAADPAPVPAPAPVPVAAPGLAPAHGPLPVETPQQMTVPVLQQGSAEATEDVFGDEDAAEVLGSLSGQPCKRHRAA